jgi:hypothetical protein
LRSFQSPSFQILSPLLSGLPVFASLLLDSFRAAFLSFLPLPYSFFAEATT